MSSVSIVLLIAFHVFGVRAVDLQLPVNCANDNTFPDMASNLKKECETGIYIKCSNGKSTIKDCYIDQNNEFCAKECGYKSCNKDKLTTQIVMYKQNSSIYGVCSGGNIIYQDKCEPQHGYNTIFDGSTCVINKPDCKPGLKIALNDCSGYVECIDKTLVLRKCPGTLKYDDVTSKRCKVGYSCPNSPNPTTTEMPTTKI